jgi:HEPN domain-containing protein
MTRNNSILAREWFAHADEDMLSCEAIIKEGGGSSTLCFLSHLIAEKYLKGLLIASGNDLVKIHDLAKLANLLKKDFPAVYEFIDELLLLNKYCVDARYPGGSEGFGWEEAKNAFEIAQKVKNFVLTSIEL